MKREKYNLDLVILCGGRGTRLGTLTDNIAKPLLQFHNISFITYLINFYKKYPIENFYFLAGYKGKLFIKEFHKKKICLSNSFVQVEKSPLGTGGCLNLIQKKLKNNFLVINADSFFNYNFNIFTKKIPNIAKMILVKNKSYYQNNNLNSLKISKKKKVIIGKSNYMNGGVYFFSKKIFNYIKKNKKSSLENDVLMPLIKKNLIDGEKLNSNFLDMGTKINYLLAKKFLNKEFKKPAAFLDRDGVLNYDKQYVHKYQDFEWRPGAIKALKYLNDNNYYIFIVTNQAGIGRGIYKENDFTDLHKKINIFLNSKNIFIDDIVFCPHHPIYGKGKYKKKCKYRKPGNQMIEKIKKNWLIDLSKSFMIGDKTTDELAAKKSKLNFFYAESNLFKQIKKITS